MLRAVNSAGECHLHTVEVTGSNPVPPTIFLTMAIKILVDTSVVRHALSHDKDPQGLPEKFKKDVEAFWSLLRSQKIRFYYTSLLDHQITRKFGAEWESMKKDYGFEKAPVSMVRLDGTQALDGSARLGDGASGVLKDIFLEDDHERKIKEKAEEDAGRQFKDIDDYKRSSRYGRQRAKEHDWEHLGAALDMGADFFITTDYKLISKLKNLTPKQTENEIVKRALAVTKSPSEALADVKGRISP